MTYNQEIALWKNIAAGHKQIKSFGNGEEWEINGILKKGIKYPILYAVPLQSVQTENTVESTYMLICMGAVFTDKTNEDEVLSDCRSILNDIVKIVKYGGFDYGISNDPVLIPAKEEYGDKVALWRTEVVLQSELGNSECDMPYESVS